MQAAIEEGTAACKELSRQIEELQGASLDTEDEKELAEINAKLDSLMKEQSEMSAKVRALNESDPAKSPAKSPTPKEASNVS